MPDIICHICLYKLEMWNEFKEQFIRSNQMLLSQLELIESSDNDVRLFSVNLKFLIIYI